MPVEGLWHSWGEMLFHHFSSVKIKNQTRFIPRPAQIISPSPHCGRTNPDTLGHLRHGAHPSSRPYRPRFEHGCYRWNGRRIAHVIPRDGPVQPSTRLHLTPSIPQQSCQCRRERNGRYPPDARSQFLSTLHQKKTNRCLSIRSRPHVSSLTFVPLVLQQPSYRL